MTMDVNKLLAEQFATDVHNRAKEVDPGGNEDWHSLALGYALGKQLTPAQASEFALYIRYKTDLG